MKRLAFYFRNLLLSWRLRKAFRLAERLNKCSLRHHYSVFAFNGRAYVWNKHDFLRLQKKGIIKPEYRWGEFVPRFAVRRKKQLAN
jgi:hypothetical protein